MVNQNISVKDVKNRLIKHSLRVTQQRIVIFKELLQTDEHPTADKLYAALKDDYPSLSLATVYKTLDTFFFKGLIKKIKANDDSFHYDADTSFHHHLICVKTDKIMDYKSEDLSVMLNKYFEKQEIDNFKINDIQLNIYGEIENSNN